jgi:hypothetical protein
MHTFLLVDTIDLGDHEANPVKVVRAFVLAQFWLRLRCEPPTRTHAAVVGGIHKTSVGVSSMRVQPSGYIQTHTHTHTHKQYLSLTQHSIAHNTHRHVLPGEEFEEVTNTKAKGLVSILECAVHECLETQRALERVQDGEFKHVDLRGDQVDARGKRKEKNPSQQQQVLVKRETHTYTHIHKVSTSATHTAATSTSLRRGDTGP